MIPDWLADRWDEWQAGTLSIEMRVPSYTPHVEGQEREDRDGKIIVWMNRPQLEAVVCEWQKLQAAQCYPMPRAVPLPGVLSYPM